MNHIRVSKSFIHREALSHAIAEQYALSNVRCQLISTTMRDVYLVTSGSGRHILMVYRHGLRTAIEVAAEWQFVDYLHAKGIPVAPAVKTKRGEYAIAFPAPEGTRYGVLSNYVDGELLRRKSSTEAVHIYGQNIAHIHTLADQMHFSLERPENNVTTIITQSVAAFEAEVRDRPHDLAYLHQCGEILCARVDSFPREEPLYGFIHGDVIRANALVSEQGTVTVIDFDLCGPGWRAYDVASYLHTIRHTPEESKFEQAFLDGYGEVRRLRASEQLMLPVFEAVRAIFSIGIPAMNIDHWGSAYFYAFLDRTLNVLRQSMARVV